MHTVTNTAGRNTISSYAYIYDKNGNRTSQAEVQNGDTLDTTYTYDTLDRLTGYTVSDGSSAAYTFDGYNRATETVTDTDGTTVTKNYSYDETNWLTSEADGTNTVTYGYDNNGNTILKSNSGDPGNDTVYDYDANNRLVRAMQGTTLLGLYDYNDQGLRIRHRNSDRGDVDYFYDGRSVIDEKSPGGGLIAHYNYADKLLSLATPAGTQFYHLDGLGSTVNLTDSTGNTKVSYFLDPWGMIIDQIGESVNRHVFTGKEEDENTGLIYFGARYYDPDTGRFITEDSYLGEPGTPPSLHRYLYAYSNPTVYIDLYGYAADDFWSIVKRIGSDAWKGVKGGLKALPVITPQLFKGYDEAVKNGYHEALKQKVPLMDNDVTRGLLATHTAVTTGLMGLGTFGLSKTSQTVEFANDPKIQNFPIVGTGLRDTYNASEEFAKKPTLENGCKVAQAGFGTLLETIGVTAGPKAAVESFKGGVPEASVTVESRSASVPVDAKPIDRGGSNEILGPEGPNQFILKGNGSLQKAAIVKKGEFINRAYDSRFGQPGVSVSGPLGESFSPGSGMPTTAAETIQRRGLDIYSTNNAQEAIVFKAGKSIPAQARTALEGVDPEYLIAPKHFTDLKEITRYPITNGKELKPE